MARIENGPLWLQRARTEAKQEALALSSRGLGRGPLKAQTRVRIPLALLLDEGCSRASIGLIVYRLGRHPFTVQRGVRFPLGLFVLEEERID
jgi:hypothetical protein